MHANYTVHFNNLDKFPEKAKPGCNSTLNVCNFGHVNLLT